MDFLLSQPGNDEDKKKDALLQELKAVNDHLEKSGKPYFGGDDVCATDLSMAPKIKHIKIGADEIKVCSTDLEDPCYLLRHDVCQSWVGKHVFCHCWLVCAMSACTDLCSHCSLAGKVLAH